MKNTTLIAFIFVSGTISMFSQSILPESYVWNLPQTIPSTPQSQIFEKYVNHKVSECNGLPDITIPLGEVAVKGLTIPVVLSYHASGIKYMQYDGEVGAGWSINVGSYRISRNINGKCDFSYQSGKGSELLDIDNEPNDLIKDRNLGQFALYERKFGTMGGIMHSSNSSRPSPPMDGEYDLFTFNTPTTKGHFIIPDGVGGANAKSLEDLSLKINMKMNFGSITDDTGNVFQFGQNGNVVEKTIIQDEFQSRITGWPLTQITTPLNEVVNFNYKKYTYNAHRDCAQFDFLMKDADLISLLSCFGEFYQTSTSSFGDLKARRGELQSSCNTSVESFFIDSIKTDHQIISFYRDNKETTSGNSPCLINCIEIKDLLSGHIKRIHFNYQKLSYFSDKYWHYLLTSIHISDGANNGKGETFHFEYNEPQFKNSTPYLYPDQWGYYCEGDNKELEKMALHKEFGSDRYLEFAHTNELSLRYKNISNLLIFPKHFVNRTQAGMPEAFALKKITYPTGGYSEYIYESNRYGSDTGGGLRIKSIISKTPGGDNAIPVISVYKYKNGKPSFPLNANNFKSMTINISLPTMSSPGYLSNLFVYTQNKLYSMYPTGDVPMWDFQVCYENVEVEQYTLSGNDTIKNGKTVFEFIIPTRYTTAPMLNSGNFPLLFTTFSQYKPEYSGINVSEYAIGYAPFYLKSKAILDQNNRLAQSEHYEYQGQTEPVYYRGIKVSQKVFMQGNHNLEEDYPKRLACGYGFPHICLSGGTNDYDVGRLYAYTYIRSFFNHMFYSIKSGGLLPAKKSVYLYDANGLNPVVTTEMYEYDSKYRLKKTILSNSPNTNLIKEFTYPANATELAKKNMISTVIETVTTHNNREIGRIKHNYPLNSILPSNTQTTASDANNLRTNIVYDLYDPKGNLRQYTNLDNVSTVFLWGYNYRYPIAEIKNATFAQVTSVIDPTTLNLILEKKEPTASDWSLINGLRTNLPYALVSTCTYKSSVGILTATDPLGVTIYYVYDNFGRLVRTQNMNGKTIQDYNYHFKNQ